VNREDFTTFVRLVVIQTEIEVFKLESPIKITKSHLSISTENIIEELEAISLLAEEPVSQIEETFDKDVSNASQTYWKGGAHLCSTLQHRLFGESHRGSCHFSDLLGGKGRGGGGGGGVLTRRNPHNIPATSG